MSVRLNINPSTLMANVHFTKNGLTKIIQMAEPAMNFHIKSKTQSTYEPVNRMKWNKTRHCLVGLELLSLRRDHMFLTRVN